MPRLKMPESQVREKNVEDDVSHDNASKNLKDPYVILFGKLDFVKCTKESDHFFESSKAAMSEAMVSTEPIPLTVSSLPCFS